MSECSGSLHDILNCYSLAGQPNLCRKQKFLVGSEGKSHTQLSHNLRTTTTPVGTAKMSLLMACEAQ